MIYVFGAYEFDTDRRVLRLAGTPVDVEPKVFDLLTYLIQHHDHGWVQPPAGSLAASWMLTPRRAWERSWRSNLFLPVRSLCAPWEQDPCRLVRQLAIRR